HADMPGVDLLKGIDFNDLGQFDKALKHLQAYQALLGHDATVCRETVQALRGLGRDQEAAGVYRRALDDEPQNEELFLEFIRSLPPGEPRDDLAARFRKLADPRRSFDVYAEDCRAAHDGDTLEQLAPVMKQID